MDHIYPHALETAPQDSMHPPAYRRRGTCPYDAQVGMLLRTTRQRQGIARRDLAAALGISVQQLSKYETGANRITVGFLHDAAALLRVPVQALLVQLDVASTPAPALSQAAAE